MALVRIKNWFIYYKRFFPFRLNFIIYTTLLLASSFLLMNQQVETSSYYILIKLMAKIILVFSSIIIFLSFLSVSLAYLYYTKQHKKDPQIILKNLSKVSESNKLQISLPHAWLPLLGYISVQFSLNKSRLLPRIVLKKNINHQFFNWGRGVKSEFELPLQEIKSYQIQEVWIYFHDMFSFFRLARKIPIQYNYKNLPKDTSIDQFEAKPKQAQEDEIRIEQLKRLDGELLQYKKFEDSDDVRRIVWKVFAKNKELIVRIPETMNPFASEIFFYASFFNATNPSHYMSYQAVMLSYYKQMVFSVFKNIQEVREAVQFASDQTNFVSSNIDSVRNHITTCEWQQENTIDVYYNKSKGSIICLHSLSNLEDVSKMLDKIDSETQVVLVCFGKLFQQNYVLSSLRRIFFHLPKDELSELKSKWLYQPLRLYMQKNEKELLSLLQKHVVNLNVMQ